MFDFADEVDEDDDAQDADDSQAADKTAVVSRRAPARKRSSTPSAPKPTPAAKPAPAPQPAAPVSQQADNETKELSRAEPEGERREASAPDAVASSREQMAKAIAARSGIDASKIPATTPKSQKEAAAPKQVRKITQGDLSLIHISEPTRPIG